MRDYSVDLAHSVHSRAGLPSSLMMRLYREFHRSDSASSLAIEGLTLELLAEISRKQPRPQELRLPKWLGLTKDLLQRISQSLCGSNLSPKLLGFIPFIWLVNSANTSGAPSATTSAIYDLFTHRPNFQNPIRHWPRSQLMQVSLIKVTSAGLSNALLT